MSRPAPPDGALSRVLGTPGAVLVGLGSIVGTGIFVTIGTAAGVSGASVLVAVVLAAAVAACNGLASAQLAAAHPVSGGAYEYGYRYLTPWLGRLAGALFVVAKTASAAAASLGFAGYALALLDRGEHAARAGLAVTAVVALTAIVAGGARRSTRVNAVIVTITVGALLAFVAATLPRLDVRNLALGDASLAGTLHATALVFVAYTGYGRLATLGEEVRDPTRTIPRAMVITLVATMALYLAVTASALGRAGAAGLADAARRTGAPLEALAPPWLQPVIAAGAMIAMLGVILNLLLGISRVVLAMARRGDLPRSLAHIETGSPRRAVLATGAAVGSLALVGSIEVTWAASAGTVLVYYAIMNVAALRVPRDQRWLPRAVPAAGLVACAGLAVWLLASVAR